MAADLAAAVMPILLERTQTSDCHPSLAGLHHQRPCVFTCVRASTLIWRSVRIPLMWTCACSLRVLRCSFSLHLFTRVDKCGLTRTALCHHSTLDMYLRPHGRPTQTHTLRYTVYVASLSVVAVFGCFPVHVTEAWDLNWQSRAEWWHRRHKQLLPASMAMPRAGQMAQSQCPSWAISSQMLLCCCPGGCAPLRELWRYPRCLSFSKTTRKLCKPFFQ